MKKLALSNLFALALALVMASAASLPASADAPLVSISGTVVSNMDGVLVLATEKGNLRFDLDKDTIMPAQIPVGSRITVDYDSDDKVTDKMDARRIVMSPEPSAVTPAPTATASTPEATPQETATTYQEEQRELPATASPLPLLAGIGLLSLAGGMLLRKRA
jgi:hypothetical protein